MAMREFRFLLILAAMLAAAPAMAAEPVVPPQNPPYDAPGHVRKAPAPILATGLPAIIAAGAAAAGYGLWRRRRRTRDR